MAHLKLRYDMTPYGTKVITQQATTNVIKNFQIASESGATTQTCDVSSAQQCVYLYPY